MIKTGSTRCEEAQLRQQITRLESRLQEALENLKACQERLTFLESHPSLVAGLKGESIVVQLAKGLTTGHNDSIDVTSVGGIRIEVKMANLNLAVKGRASETLRWAWAQILGIGGNKTFDRLILLGEKDKRFLNEYLDRACPYIIFDIPFADLIPDRNGLLMQTGRHLSIQLTTNPRTVRGIGKQLLFRQYQTTTQEIESKYGLK